MPRAAHVYRVEARLGTTGPWTTLDHNAGLANASCANPEGVRTRPEVGGGIVSTKLGVRRGVAAFTVDVTAPTLALFWGRWGRLYEWRLYPTGTAQGEIRWTCTAPLSASALLTPAGLTLVVGLLPIDGITTEAVPAP